MAAMPALAITVSKVEVKVTGADNEVLRDNVRLKLALNNEVGKDISARRLNYLLREAEAETREALEPFGYYSPTITIQRSDRNDAEDAERRDVDPDDPARDTSSDVGDSVTPNITAQQRRQARGERTLTVSIQVDPGAPVRIRVWAQGTELTGKVREVAASSDPVTRTYPVKVSIEGKAPPLGSTVYAILDSGAATGTPVLKLPTSALRQEGQATTVWVLDKASMTVRSQVIQVATADGNDVVVGSGLAPGMLVVSAGVHVLSPGQKVTIYEQKLPSAQSGRVQAAPDSIAKPTMALPAAPASGTK